MAGEAEPLRKFGANVIETNVQTYALANGIARSAKAMTDQQKIMARAGLVSQQLGYADNDLANTADSAANQFRKAGGGVQEFGVRIGEFLLPAATKATEGFNELLGAILDLAESSGPTLASWGQSLANIFGGIGILVRNFGDLWTIAKLRVGEFVANSVAYLDVLPENFGRVLDWLTKNWKNVLVDWFNLNKEFWSNLVINIGSAIKSIWDALRGQPWEFTWKPLLDGFKATSEALPELIKPALISVDDEVNAIWSKIGAREAARASALGQQAAPKKPPGEVKKPEKPADYRLASAVEIGTKEAYSIVAKSLSPRPNDPQRQQVNLQRDANGILRDIRDQNQRNRAPQLAVR